MLVLIDESGDAGFKIYRGSSPYFIICMVVFHDFLEAERADDVIDSVRKGCRHTGEFRFSKVSYNVRDAFFEATHGNRLQS